MEGLPTATSEHGLVSFLPSFLPSFFAALFVHCPPTLFRAQLRPRLTDQRINFGIRSLGLVNFVFV